MLVEITMATPLKREGEERETHRREMKCLPPCVRWELGEGEGKVKNRKGTRVETGVLKVCTLHT